MPRPDKPKGLFLNTAHARCSIHESGMMAYQSLRGSDRFHLEYQEVGFDNRRVSRGYDFYLFNYHDTTSMAWLDTRCVRELPGLKMTLVLEVAPNDPFVRVSPDDFDTYLALDPTMAKIGRKAYPFPRPLEVPEALGAPPEGGPPVIGTFGLPTAGKGFDKIIAAVNREFDRAILRMNIPVGDHTLPSQHQEVEGAIADLVRAARPGIDVVVTRDFMSKAELIRWCSQNTLNVFLYDRAVPGLAATTDQAISSLRPLAVSANETFRHIHVYSPPYPYRSLRQAIELSGTEVSAMREAWSPRSFAHTFELMLDNVQLRPGPLHDGEFVLRGHTAVSRALRPFRATDLVPAVVPKVIEKVRRRLSKTQPPPLAKPLKPFASPLLSSFSPRAEDLWLDLLLRGKTQGFYVDVGAEDPRSGNNSYRFYKRGWSGINVTFSAEARACFERERPRDLNLSLMLSASEDQKRQYTLDIDGRRWSTFDPDTARDSAERLRVKADERLVSTVSLSKILTDHGQGRIPDFIALDARGHESAVLAGNDWGRCRPAFILAAMTSNRNRIVQFLQQWDYGLLINNERNGLFVDVASTSNMVQELLARGRQERR